MLDFCIIGAPKSGTTSLFNWLNAHPQLEGANPKETHFLMDKEHPLWGACGASYSADAAGTYAQFFSREDSGRKRFEATPQYFYQHTAHDYLTSLPAQPHIIMLMREPANRILSSFRFTRDNLANCDGTLTFDHYADCLLCNKVSQLDRFFRADDSLYIAKRELQLSRYVEWLDWWNEALEPGKLEPIVFDELKFNPHAVMARLSAHLGIDGGFYNAFNFGQDNATYPVGNQLVHRLIRPLGGCLPGGAVKETLKTKYLAWQRNRAVPDGDYESGLQALRQYFAPWNRTLADRYGLDLEHWWGNSVAGS